MKKWLPWIIPAFFAVWVLSNLQPRPEKSAFNIREFGKLPALLNGRLQPLDSVARNSLLIMRAKQNVRTGDPAKPVLSASEWLAELFMHPETADERKVFRIDNVELLGLLRLSSDEKHFSFTEISPRWGELEAQAKRISGLETQVRTVFEKQLMKLHEGLSMYVRLKNSFAPEASHDFAKEIDTFQKAIGPGLVAVEKSQAGEKYEEKDLQVMADFFRRYQTVAQVAYPLVVPPRPGKDGPQDWRNLGNSLLESMRSGEVHPALIQFATMSSAFHHNRPEEFNQALASYTQWVYQHYPAESKKAAREFFFNGLQPFYKSTSIYVFALILGCLSWFNWSKLLNLSAFRLVGLGFIIHTAGLVFRMVLEGRPPVTNLYSSAIFVGWGAVLLGLVMERIFRNGIGSVVASSIGFITLIIAHNLSLDGDTMVMLRAVLDTNFWLATHVIVITLGYSSVFVSGLIAIVYVILGVFTRKLTPETSKSLTRMVYGVVCFSTLFSFAGTVLGGIWADQSWGRFWGWDPKENGALLIVIWCAIVLHARWGGMIRERGLMGAAIFGNVITSFSWFGVNMLGVGLHSYGFMDQAFKWLMLFCLSQIVLIGFTMLPLRYWQSYAALQRTPAKDPPGATRPAKTKPLPAGA